MSLWFDLKYAWRLLTKSWGYSLMCAGVVALSVGLALWTYLLVYSQALKPMDFPGAERWYSVQLASDATAVASPTVDAFTYQELLDRKRTADYLGAFSTGSAVLSEGQASTSLRAASISPRLLAATKTAPQLGRLFDAADSEPGAAPTAILSYNTWKNYFAADPAIVGKQARIDSGPVQIVGVMPEDFYAFQDFEVWMPLKPTILAAPSETAPLLAPFILLGDGQSLDTIVNEMKVVVDDVNKRYPNLFKAARHVQIFPAHQMSTHALLPVVTMLSVLSIAVLLLGCVNISLVFLAQLLERSRELALRTAIGASRPRLLRQVLLETALVVLIGLVGGCGLAALGVDWTHGLYDFGSQVQGTGRPSNMFNLRAVDLVVAVVVAALVWLLSTLIPARRTAKQDAAVVLAGTGKGSAVRGSARSVGVLVGLQVLISCLVLVISGNLLLAVQDELNKPLGMDTSQVVVSTYPTVFGERYADATKRQRYWEDLADKVANDMPGAKVAYFTSVPTRPSSVAMALESQEGATNNGALTLPFAEVSDEYFDLLGIPLRSGRLFDSTDNSASLNVAVVDEAMARRAWPNEDALGKRVQLNPSADSPWLTVVGVVASVAKQPFDREVGVIYRPFRQAVPTEFRIMVKLPDTIANTAPSSRATLRAAAFAVDRDLPLHNVQTLDDYLDALNIANSALIPVLSVVSTITAFLAATGLFGLISRSVAQRTQEVGIRRALGATRWRSISIFLRQGGIYLSVGIVGVGLGVAVTNLLGAAIPNLLARVGPVTLSVFALMALVIFAASYLPTRRAVALEPGDALRYE